MPAGRPIGVLECLEGTIHPFVLHRAWLEVAALPRDEQLRALMSGPLRDRLLAEVPPSATPIVNLLVQGWGRMYAVGVGNVNYEPDPTADSLASVSVRTGVPAAALALDAMLAHDGHGMLYVPLFNYSSGDLSMLHELHQHPSTRMGLSDAGAHCGSICDGGMPTFMLTHWTRDRTRGPLLGLEQVVHRQTAQTAALFGLHDRGLLAPGMKADVNIIDYDNLTFGNARMAYDFPANARRLVQGAKGYVATVCSGTVIVEHDAFTGALPGRLLRGPVGIRSGQHTGSC